MAIWIEAIGFCGTACAIAADAMRRMLPLRIVAVLSSLFFLAYGALIGSAPMLAMELILLPINGFRLLELLRERRRPTAAPG
jgi:CRP/FNR family cyclic AMP-dependent transcriptional regulator